MFGPAVIGGHPQSRLVKPAGNHHARGKQSGFASQKDKNALRDFLGGLGIAAMPQGRGIDESQPAFDQLGKRRLIPAQSKVTQKFEVARFVHLPDIVRQTRKPDNKRQKNWHHR